MTSMLRAAASWLWYDGSAAAALVRHGLTPLSTLFGAAVARRNARYDRGATAAPGTDLPLVPALSVGNLTVGGTGKTPVASWFAATLSARGARPALVLRGYGDDEWRVHELLTPDVPVLLAPERVQAMRAAAARGADCVVLDDAFQHRRAPRVSDVVLVSADRWNGRVQLLPAGPFREPLGSLQRATCAIVTAKTATTGSIDSVCRAIGAVVPTLPLAVVRLVPQALHRATEPDAAPRPISSVAGVRVMMVSAIGDADAFERQLRDHGAMIVHHARHPDHHAFTPRDVAAVSRVLHGVDLVVCTLKDAVKLASLWPRAGAPLWYVSQTVVVDRGAEVLERECDRVLGAR